MTEIRHLTGSDTDALDAAEALVGAVVEANLERARGATPQRV